MANRYDTGNAVGSADPRDLFDNSIVIDEFANSSSETAVDRLGTTRKTLTGLQASVADAIADAGYTGTGVDGAIEEYAAGIEITQYNQVVRDVNGEFWKVTGATDLPYTTTGAGLPEGGTFVSVGDAVLRQALIDNTGGAGSDLVAHAGTGSTVTETLDKNSADIAKRVIYLSSVAESFAGSVGAPNQPYSVIAWHSGGGAELAPKGGGAFVFKADVPKSEHDGGYVISPTVPALSAQAGADLDARLANFLDGTGETDGAGTGCYVRVRAGEYENEANVCQFGGKTDRTTDVSAIISRMLHLNLPIVLPAGQHAWLSTLTITDQDGFWLKGVGYQTVVIPDLTGDAIELRTAFEKEGVIIENMRVSNRGADVVPARTDTPTNFVSIDGFPHNRFRNIKFQRFDCTNSIIKNKKAYGCSLERIRCYQCRVGLAFWELNQLPDDSVEQSYMSDGYDIDVTGLTTEGAATDAYAFYFEGGMLELDKVVVQSSQHVFAYGDNNTINPTMLLKNIYVENNDGYILRDLGGSASGSPPMIDINGWRDVASNTNHLYDLGSSEVRLKQWRSTTDSANYTAGGARIRIDAPSRYTNRIMKSGAGFIGTPDRARIISGAGAADLPFTHSPGDINRWSSFLVMLSRPAQGGYRTITDLYHVTVNQESSVVATRISRVDGGEASGTGALPDWEFSLSDGVVQVSQSQSGSYTAQICSNNSYSPTP